MAKRISLIITILILLGCQSKNQVTNSTEATDSIIREHVTFESEGVNLVGTIYKPKNSHAAVVIVHGSDQVGRETEFAERLAKNNISVFTFDKRGVAESGGIYAGPEVGTNNIDTINLILLAKDASAAVDVLQKNIKDIPIGLVGFSQAGWIMPIAATKNATIEFMVLFSCPLITTLEQLRFQFHTNGRTDYWKHHTEADARHHTFNDPDKYQFIETDPKVSLNDLFIPGLWLFGEKDIQIPVKLCMEYLDEFKAKGKPFEYSLFPTLGHNTSSASITAPFDLSIEWIKQKSITL